MAIRGSKDGDWSDTLTDIKSICDGFIPTGENMYNKLASAKKKLEEKLSISLTNDNTKYLVTGHSLGGASCGRMSSELFNKDNINPDKYFMYTFASPKYCLDDSCKDMIFSHNIINKYTGSAILPWKCGDGDWVPTVPGSCLRKFWKLCGHYGTNYVFDLDPNTCPQYHEKLKWLYDAGDDYNWVKDMWSAHILTTYFAAMETIDPHASVSLNCRIVSAHCPVDVYVMDQSGYCCASVVGGVVTNDVLSPVRISVDGDEKYIDVPENNGYLVKMVATDSGEMVYKDQVFKEDADVVEEMVFNNVSLVKDKVFTSSLGHESTSDTKLFVLDEDGYPRKEVDTDGTEKDIKDLKYAKLEDIPDQTYTGKEITPDLNITLNETKLKLGSDYTVSFENNVNVGTASMTIYGKGDYTGELTSSFEIVSAKIIVAVTDNEKIYGKADPATTYKTYDDEGIEIFPAVSVTITREAGENVGDYKYSAISQDINYAVSATTGKLTIKVMGISVEVTDNEKTYSKADPATTYKTFNDEGIEITPAVSATITRETGEDVGDYNYSATSKDPNYVVTSTTGKLTVKEMNITVAVNNCEKAFGKEDPIPSYKTFDDESKEIVPPVVVEITREEGESLGEYSYFATSQNSNYVVNITTGKLTIKAMSITVAVTDSEKTFSKADPATTYKTYDDEGSEITPTVSATITRETGEDVGDYNYSATSQDSNYVVASTTGKLTIKAMNITVAVTDTEKTYSKSDPSTTYKTYNDKWTEITPPVSVTITRETGENVGDYNYSAASKDPNYMVTATSGKLIIKPLDINVKVKDTEKQFGDEDPEYKADCYDTEGKLVTNPPVLIFERESGENVGEYNITASTDDNNYNILSTTGKLTIVKRSIEVPVGIEGLRYTGQAQNGVPESVWYSEVSELNEECVLPGNYVTKIQLNDTDNTAWSDGSIDNKSVKWTIGKAILTATYPGESVTLGQNPDYKVDVSGFVNGETEKTAKDYVAPQLSKPDSLNVGEYTLTPANGSAAYYDFVYQSGVLKVVDGDQKQEAVTNNPSSSSTTGDSGLVVAIIFCILLSGSLVFAYRIRKNN